jgi:plasmid stabilization system protein ParE
VTLQVRISHAARSELRELVSWWRTHRPKAPGHLAWELKRVLILLADAPNIGTLYPHRSGANIRRFRLRRTPYHVFYEVDEAGTLVTVLAVWSSMRRTGPPL